MKLPEKYQWITKVKGLPATIREGIKLLGTKEVVGKGSNRTIMQWRDELNGATKNGKPIVTGFSDDDTPWCGLYAAIVAFRRLGKIEEVPASPLWARNWAKYGKPAKTAALGDVLVFVRGSGGHVGFYIAEDASAYHVLGGNQSNAVTITRIEKSRCIAIRRPPYVTIPAGAKPYRMAASGAVSVNEA
jgi:uncharacterized protein (TIGR02594 family)